MSDSGEVLRVTATQEASNLETTESFLRLLCAGRALKAQAADRIDRMFKVLAAVPSLYFSTCEEQFGPIQASFALTGVAFGR